MQIIALDLETTWLDNKKDKIIEIALVKFDTDTFEIIENCSLEDLNIRERYWQDFYDVLNGGLNCQLTTADNCPAILSEEYKNKIDKWVCNARETRVFKSFDDCTAWSWWDSCGEWIWF